ncbi:hypothetical protein [Pseudothioclava nitratireducens]|uniref:hypothetical protein n=1 Tax=Pseudothioclava nitratireducens TaxID=1928646 RepID=UPI0023D9988E|nr:hypothetical protein [Defluviimonas nitratireducens]MDF1621645.1 hypothetical protein [Defluviimonas nitratireducens]
MIDKPKIPMSPSELPRQRLVEVIDLPPRPEGFTPVVDYCLTDEGVGPKRRPREMLFLGGAEWAWSPMHNRIEAYYLHRGRNYWITYHRDLEAEDREFEWSIGAYVEKRGVNARQAAVHLMIARWRFEADNGLDEFHWLIHDGFLTVPDWRAISRAVWGCHDAE